MSYLPNYIINKLTVEELKFISIARTIKQPEFLEMLQKLKVGEGISVKLEGNVKYTNVYMTAKRYSILLNIKISTIKRKGDVVIVRKN